MCLLFQHECTTDSQRAYTVRVVQNRGTAHALLRVKLLLKLEMPCRCFTIKASQEREGIMSPEVLEVF